MSYIALYRKLRPKTFDDVLGQTHIITTIKNQIISERVSHAYLFCGTRGTGKTSTAKLFAKVINCISPIEGEPCNVCEFCQEVDRGTSMNVIEIDAASNNGVDNIRELREEVKYSPAKGKYKVYIIDEVHMLSTGAFNALLKTLEEPPEHVVFILATTDPQKIPATILSRCQRFDFKRITVYDMTERLKKYMADEGLNVEEPALRYISRVSDGAMRDALSILDQTITMYYNQEITLKNVLEVIGSVDDQVFFDLTDALVKFDSKLCIEIIDALVVNGRDINQFVADYLTHLRNLLISMNIKSASTALDLSGENIEKLSKQGDKLEQDILLNYINAFANLQGEIKYSSNERIFLEITCIKLCNPETQDAKETLIARLKKLETKLENGVVVGASNNANTNTKPENIVKKKIDKAIPKDIEDVVKSWRGFADSFKMPIKGYLLNSFAKFLEGNVLTIVSGDVTVTGRLLSNEEKIKEGLAKMYKKEFNINFMPKEEYDIRHKQIYGEVDEDLTENKYFTEILGDDIIIDK